MPQLSMWNMSQITQTMRTAEPVGVGASTFYNHDHTGDITRRTITGSRTAAALYRIFSSGNFQPPIADIYCKKNLFVCFSTERMTGMMTTTTATLPGAMSAIHWFVCGVCVVFAIHIRDFENGCSDIIREPFPQYVRDPQRGYDRAPHPPALPGGCQRFRTGHTNNMIPQHTQQSSSRYPAALGGALFFTVLT